MKEIRVKLENKSLENLKLLKETFEYKTNKKCIDNIFHAYT